MISESPSPCRGIPNRRAQKSVAPVEQPDRRGIGSPSRTRPDRRIRPASSEGRALPDEARPGLARRTRTHQQGGRRQISGAASRGDPRRLRMLPAANDQGCHRRAPGPRNTTGPNPRRGLLPLRRNVEVRTGWASAPGHHPAGRCRDGIHHRERGDPVQPPGGLV